MIVLSVAILQSHQAIFHNISTQESAPGRIHTHRKQSCRGDSGPWQQSGRRYTSLVMKGQRSSCPSDLCDPCDASSLHQDSGPLYAVNNSTHIEVSFSLRLLFNIVWQGAHGVNASSLLHLYAESTALHCVSFTLIVTFEAMSSSAGI